MRRTLPRGLRACSVPAMELDLVGRRAAVMASSDGIGKAIACALAREGVHVMMCGRDDGQARRARWRRRRPSRATARRSPASASTSPRPRARRCSSRPPRPRSAGSTSSLTNTGGPPAGPLLGFDDEAWQKAFESRAALGRARRARRACRTSRPPIRGASSRSRPPRSRRRSAASGFSNVFRPGIHGLVKTLAEELGPKGITVNLIAPGKIDTARVRWLDDTRAERTGTSGAEVRAASERDIPLGRYGEPAELAEVAVFLCSKAGALRLGHGDAGRRRPRASALAA